MRSVHHASPPWSSIHRIWSSSRNSVASAGVLYVWSRRLLSSAILRSSEAGVHRPDASIASIRSIAAGEHTGSTSPRRRRSTSGARSSTRRRPRRPRQAAGGGCRVDDHQASAAGTTRRGSDGDTGRRLVVGQRVDVDLGRLDLRSVARLAAHDEGRIEMGGTRRHRRTSTRTRRTRGARCAGGSVRTWPRPRTTSSRRSRGAPRIRRGGRNSSVMPRRMAPTTDLTGSWRWEVPSHVDETSASAATAAGRTRDGPHPKRPSTGKSSEGMRIAWRSTPATVPA